MHFLWPWMFVVLPLPLLVRWLFPAASEQGEAALYIPFYAQVIESNTAQNDFNSQRTRQIIAWLVWLLLVIAAARPIYFEPPIPVQREGRSVLLLLDLSGSMLEQDMRTARGTTTRIAVARGVSGEFVKRRTGDRVGLILFGSQAYLQAPLTFDLATVQTFIDETEIGLAGRQTAIGDAIGLAVRQFAQIDGEKVAILLTDGSNNAGVVEPAEAAAVAAEAGIKIHTIAFGADEMIVNDPFWGQRRVNPSHDLDEVMMDKVASLTGGSYFRARNPNELESAYRAIDQIDPVVTEDVYIRPITELYFWPLAAALLLSAVAAAFVLFAALAERLQLPLFWHKSEKESNNGNNSVGGKA